MGVNEQAENAVLGTERAQGKEGEVRGKMIREGYSRGFEEVSLCLYK